MMKHWQRRLVFSIALAAASVGLAGCSDSDDSNKPAAKTAEEALGIQPNKESNKRVETTHDVTVIQDTKVVDSKTGEVISQKKDVTPVRVTQEKQVKTDVNVKVGETQPAAK